MSDHESAEPRHPEWIDSFSLPHPMDRFALIGTEAVRAEKMLAGRKQAREGFQGIDQSDSKHSFTGSATIFRNPDGTLYAMVHTEWVGKDGETDPENTSWDVRVPLTEQQLQTLRDARQAGNQEK